MPVINYYSSLGKCKKINGLGTIEEVFSNVKKALDGFI